MKPSQWIIERHNYHCSKSLKEVRHKGLGAFDNAILDYLDMQSNVPQIPHE